MLELIKELNKFLDHYNELAKREAEHFLHQDKIYARTKHNLDKLDFVITKMVEEIAKENEPIIMLNDYGLMDKLREAAKKRRKDPMENK